MQREACHAAFLGGTMHYALGKSKRKVRRWLLFCSSMEQNRNVIGANLRRLRVAKDFSQERLSVQCARLGYEFPRGTLAKIEAGIRAVSDVELFVLSHALRVALTEFFPDGLLRRLKAGDVKPFHVRRGAKDAMDS